MFQMKKRSLESYLYYSGFQSYFWWMVLSFWISESVLVLTQLGNSKHFWEYPLQRTSDTCTSPIIRIRGSLKHKYNAKREEKNTSSISGSAATQLNAQAAKTYCGSHSKKTVNEFSFRAYISILKGLVHIFIINVRNDGWLRYF